MSYINFVIITDTPARLRTFLVNREIIKQVNDGIGGTIYIGSLSGMEWVELPNPIVTDPGPPSIHDTRRVFLVKFAWESREQKADAFKQWIIDNSTIVQAPVGWTIYGQPATGDIYKINGEQVWLVKDAAERFGVWQ